VVRLIGCCTEKDPVFVIIEYVSLGKLQTLLRFGTTEIIYLNINGKISQKLKSGEKLQ
jgi:fibroblast growth factor receptor 1